jgi:hypothetical protein
MRSLCCVSVYPLICFVLLAVRIIIKVKQEIILLYVCYLRDLWDLLALLYFYLHYGLRKDFVPSGFPTKIFHAFLPSPHMLHVLPGLRWPRGAMVGSEGH